MFSKIKTLASYIILKDDQMGPIDYLLALDIIKKSEILSSVEHSRYVEKITFHNGKSENEGYMAFTLYFHYRKPMKVHFGEFRFIPKKPANFDTFCNNAQILMNKQFDRMSHFVDVLSGWPVHLDKTEPRVDEVNAAENKMEKRRVKKSSWLEKLYNETVVIMEKRHPERFAGYKDRYGM